METRSPLRGSSPARHTDAIVDCHAHIFDPVRFPFHESGTYPLAANEIGDAVQYQAVLDAHGIGYGILINPLGGYGLDNGYMLSAIAASGGRLKGVAVVPTDIREREAVALKEQGVEGIRFSLHHPASPSLLDGNGARILELARQVGWKVLVHNTEDLVENVMPLLMACKTTLVIDHCGRPALGRGLDQPGFQAVLKLAQRENTYIKLSGVFRFTEQPWPHLDTEPYVGALIEAFGIERCIWGSDWPFTRMERRIDYGPLLALTRRWFPDDGDRRKVLCANPAQLFSLT